MKELECKNCKDLYVSDFADGTSEVARELCRRCIEEWGEASVY